MRVNQFNPTTETKKIVHSNLTELNKEGLEYVIEPKNFKSVVVLLKIEACTFRRYL